MNTEAAEKLDLRELARLYWPLIFTLFFFIDVVAEPISTLNVVLMIAAYAVQILLFHITATDKNQYLALSCIFLSIGLSVACSYTNMSAYAFYWYSAYYGAQRFSLRGALGILSLVVCSIIASAVLFNYVVFWYFLPALLPVVGLFVVGYLDKLDRQHQQAQKKSRQEIEQLAHIAERERIARDLHDVMGHSLTTIALKAQLADKLAKNGESEKAFKEIAEVAKLSSETLTEMRGVVTGYKAQSIEALIEKLCASLNKWNFEVEQSLNFPKLSAQQESTLALVLTEAITNIIKHSNGDTVTLKTETGSEADAEFHWALHIADNGKVVSALPGNGLKGMRERLEQIGARLETNTNHGMQLAIYFNNQANSKN